MRLIWSWDSTVTARIHNYIPWIDQADCASAVV